ncbi:MAG TPA: DUF4129 domain-containing protein [Bacillus bacterium]|nr:DUF4129 domain-containing protein [Bacillus sp. (in: firmicutes)]
MTNQHRFNLYNVGLYSLGFILFWEWLRPLEVVTDTGNSLYFIVFTAACFLLYFLKIPFWYSVPIRFVLLLYILHQLFFEGSFLQIGWLYRLYEDASINTQALLDARWLEMSNLFRSFLFLILLWVMSYLMQYWLIQAKRILGFYIITIIYLGVLDTFTRYDAGNAIVRTIIIGLLIVASLQMLRLQEKEGIAVRPYWLLPLSFMIALSVVLGLNVPKIGPQWPDPVPFIKSAAQEQFFDSGVKKIGYDVDDSKLGGAFTNDYTTVFTAEVKKAHYWRIESKDFYTGKGWEVSEKFPQILIDKDNIHLSIFENVTKENNLKANITIENAGSYPHIAYPSGIRSLKTEQNVQLLAEPFTGKLFTEKNGDVVQLRSYEITYDYPVFSIEALKLANGGDNTYIRRIYTQLPENLPERVKKLANEITKGKAPRYEKAKAIEAYFSEHGFLYETKNVAIPEADEDYVDQFLFETKKGYCDNFSTSMVVLLRSLDIPARWVKGYTQGEFIKPLDDDARLYAVKNANAHSWVEVYFPGIGWVPFEPTQGFSNLNIFTANAVPVASQAIQNAEEQKEQKENIEAKKDSEQKGNKKIGSDMLKGINVPFKEASIFVALALLVVGLLIKMKTTWYPYWILAKYRIRKSKLGPKEALETLFLLLGNKGLKIQDGETLREFATRVDVKLGSSEMKKIAEIYEKLLYSKREPKSQELAIIFELWESLFKKIVP